MDDTTYNHWITLLCIAAGTVLTIICLIFYFFDGAITMTEHCMKVTSIVSLVLIGLAIMLLLVVAGFAICKKTIRNERIPTQCVCDIVRSHQEMCDIVAQFGQDAKFILVHEDAKDRLAITRYKNLQDAFNKIENGDKLYICDKKMELDTQTLRMLNSKLDNLKKITICVGNSDFNGPICCEVDKSPANSDDAE